MEPNHPWDGHDQEDQAEARYNVPLHAQNQLLETENLRLKRLLREAGIPWNDRVASHPGFQPSVNAVSSSGSGSQPSLNSRTTVRRSSRLSAVEHVSHSLPHLPVEVILRIMEYALYSAEPIIDPLCKLTNETLTVAEAKRGPQIAFGFLATCKAYRVEGKRFFWTRNIFTFTSPEALRRFADLDESLRQSVRRINLRVIARYYDDEERDHKVTNYHSCFKKAQSLPIIRRHKEANRLARSGFVSCSSHFVYSSYGIMLPCKVSCLLVTGLLIRNSAPTLGLKSLTFSMPCVLRLTRPDPRVVSTPDLAFFPS